MGKWARVLVLGSKQSGKTSILEQAINGNLGPFAPTIEDIYVASVDHSEPIHFFDTEGITVLDVFPRHLLAVADGIVIVFALDDTQSLQLAELLKQEVERNKEKKDLPIVLLGNKADLCDRRTAPSTTELERWATKERVKLFEVSALDRNSLSAPFLYLSQKIFAAQNRSGFSQINLGRSKN